MTKSASADREERDFLSAQKKQVKNGGNPHIADVPIKTKGPPLEKLGVEAMAPEAS